MADIVILGPDGNPYAFAAGTSREVMRAAMARRFPASRREAVVAGSKSGFENVANVFTGAIGKLVDKFGITPAQATAWAAENLSDKSPAEAQRIAQNLKSLPGFGDIVKAGGEARQQRFEGVKASRPGYFAAGKVAGEVAATVPFIAAGGGALSRLGGAATKVAPRLGAAAPAVKTAGRAVQQLGKSVKTGGIGVRAPTRTAVEAGAPVAATLAKRIGLRVAGGAGAGAAGAALTDQDVSDAAMIGGGLPIAANVAKHGMGYVFDKLTGRFGQVRAGEIIRNLIADKSSGIMEALANAPKNIRANTAEFLAERGLLTPELAAATRIVSSGAASKPLQKVALARAEEQNAMRAQMAGADTQTGAVANIKEAKKQVRIDTEATREAALGAADVGRTKILPAEREAARLADLAADEAATARRLLSGAETQTERLGQMDELNQMRQSEIDFGYRDNTLGVDFPPNVIDRQGDVIAGLERFGGEAADRSLVAGQDSRSAAEVAVNLRRRGLKALDISNVVSRLRQQASNAEFVSPDRANVFSAFADALERRAAKFGGVIDATGLHLARREMGQFVANTLKGSDPQTIRLGTSKLIGEAQPLIDEAIEAAGGRGWKDYLSAFSQGMRKAEQQDFGRKLAALPEARLNKVMRGDDPDFVEQSFGPGRFDINAEYIGALPPEAGKAAAQKLSGQIGATRAVAQTGLEDLSASQRLGLPAGAAARTEEAFKPGVANRMVQAVSNMIGGAPGVYGGGRLVSQAEAALANRLYTNTMRQLAPGLASPSEALRLAQMMPASNYFNTAVNQMPDTLLGGIPRALVLSGINENRLPAEEAQFRVRR